MTDLSSAIRIDNNLYFLYFSADNKEAGFASIDLDALNN
jgi:hypothetical protein